MDFPYNDNTGKAWVHDNPEWIQMEWLYPGDRPFTLFRAFRKVEKAAKEQGFKGWLMASERSHANMHRHIIRWGGKPYKVDDQNVYFLKELN